MPYNVKRLAVRQELKNENLKIMNKDLKKGSSVKSEISPADSKPMLGEGTVSRVEVEVLIEQKREQRKQLDKEIIELRKQWCLISDDKQWFKEEKEMVTIREGRKKIKVEKMIGRIHWMEELKDESTEKPLILERSQVVTVDGKWEW